MLDRLCPLPSANSQPTRRSGRGFASPWDNAEWNEVRNMAAAPKRIKVTPGSELARLLEEARRGPVLLEENGSLYRLDRVEQESEDIWAGYDPERVRVAIDTYGGSWKDLDAEALKASIYRAREEGSRPPDRP